MQHFTRNDSSHSGTIRRAETCPGRPTKVRELDRLLLLDILAIVALVLALVCIKGGG